MAWVEVYRARDPKLDREVAIKVLPDAFAADADRLARFTREAQTLAALNHPNIASVYGFEESAARARSSWSWCQARTCRGHIARGPIPPADAMPIARQIADALETAHEQDIIHRDLKPANIKVRDGRHGQSARLRVGEGAGGHGGHEAAEMPRTRRRSRTGRPRLGMILGTAAYMSPEQAKGKPVDRRADIWAFGVVLYEMLTGRRAFEGEDISTTLAAVLMKDPEWASLPPGTPASLDTLVRRCLERDPKKRLRDIGEARILLSDPEAAAAGTSIQQNRSDCTTTEPTSLAGRGGRGSCSDRFRVLCGPAARRAPRQLADRIVASIALPADTSIARRFCTVTGRPQARHGTIRQHDGRRSPWHYEVWTTVRPNHWRTPKAAKCRSGRRRAREIAFFAEGKLKMIDLQGGPAQVSATRRRPAAARGARTTRSCSSGSFRTPLEKVAASRRKQGQSALETRRIQKREEPSVAGVPARRHACSVRRPDRRRWLEGR